MAAVCSRHMVAAAEQSLSSSGRAAVPAVRASCSGAAAPRPDPAGTFQAIAHCPISRQLHIAQSAGAAQQYRHPVLQRLIANNAPCAACPQMMALHVFPALRTLKLIDQVMSQHATLGRYSGVINPAALTPCHLQLQVVDLFAHCLQNTLLPVGLIFLVVANTLSAPFPLSDLTHPPTHPLAHAPEPPRASRP